jgi:hypothetical protein
MVVFKHGQLYMTEQLQTLRQATWAKHTHTLH